MSLLITSFSRFSFFLNFFSQRNVLSEERSRRSSFLPKKSTKGPLSFFFRSKKKVVRGKIRCQLNSYWTGRTGRRHGFGSFPPRCGAEGVWSRTVWVRRVTDPLTHLLQSSLIFFFLLERKFFKEGAGRGGERREREPTGTHEMGMVHLAGHRLAGATGGDFCSSENCLSHPAPSKGVWYVSHMIEKHW